MKQFLRYQVSGSVFIFWLIIFYYGDRANNIEDLVNLILASETKTLKVLLGLVAALPIGVIIHQFSVLLKNCILGWKLEEFSDYPNTANILKLEKNKESVSYILERVSNLNTFYYVRFDNGVLSPVLAWLIIGTKVNCIWLLSASIIGLVTVVYVFRIYKELKKYNNILKKIN